MLIINADDWGRSPIETDAALACYRAGRITSTSAMVFMADAERAACLASDCGIDVGLHLNLTQAFSGQVSSPSVAKTQDRILSFTARRRLSVFLYHPGLRGAFRDMFQAQMDEFLRLYGRPPSHVDGHHHMHLCANMIVDAVVPKGLKVRRTFSYASGEKSWGNRLYRAAVARWQERRYVTPNYLFSLLECLRNDRLNRVFDLARHSTVELETHPELPEEFQWLMGDAWGRTLAGLRMGTYSQLTSIA